MFDKLKKLFGQAVRFGLVGVVNTLVDYTVYFLLMRIPFVSEHYLIAQVCGYSAGMVNSLFMNKYFTFKQKEKMSLKQVGLFVLVNLLALGMSSLVLIFAEEKLMLGHFWSKTISMAGSIVVNFVGSRFLVFRKK